METTGNRERKRSMESVHSASGRREGQNDSLSARPHASHFDLDALREENKQLKELVVQLSEIVVKNVLDRK